MIGERMGGFQRIGHTGRERQSGTCAWRQSDGPAQREYGVENGPDCAREGAGQCLRVGGCAPPAKKFRPVCLILRSGL